MEKDISISLKFYVENLNGNIHMQEELKAVIQTAGAILS